MKILIQNCITNRYLAENSQWRKSRDAAKPFKSSAQAMDYCNRFQLPDAQVVLTLEGKNDEEDEPISTGLWP